MQGVALAKRLTIGVSVRLCDWRRGRVSAHRSKESQQGHQWPTIICLQASN